MFFKPRFFKETGNKFRFSRDVKVTLQGTARGFLEKRAKEIIERYPICDCVTDECTEIVFTLGVPESVKSDVEKLTGKAFSDNKEAYVVYTGAKTEVFANDESGLIFGLATIEQMLSQKELCAAVWYDYPVVPVRGFRMYTPGINQMDDFRKVVDLLVYYKYNSIIMEIGGAMEYKNHPEINKSWETMCTSMREYPGKSIDTQRGCGFEKNSIHIDNGDGSFRTQDDMRGIIAYCAERGIEVIPEMPSLSHTDYMLFDRPDLHERPNDPHADTYCPSNPDSYALYFELLDEVIDVFHPEYINIGHDEVYSLCICEKCKQRDPIEIFVSDIEKIRLHLAEKNIKVIMWGENLLNAETEDGTPVGGAEWFYIEAETGERITFKHALFDSAGKISSEVTMLHWYWVFDENLDKVYHDNGHPMFYGNLRVSMLKNWKKRVEWGALGGYVSNWGSIADEYMQRNIQSFELVYSAYAFWCDDYDDCGDDDAVRNQFSDRATEESYRYRNTRIICDAEKAEGNANFIKVLHTTDYEIKRDRYFYDGFFMTDEVYLIGHYILTYSDGTTDKIGVRYGNNLSNWDIKKDIKAETYTETLYGTLPQKIDDKLYYECLFENPQKGKQITDIRFESEPGKNANVFLKSYELF